MARWRLRNAEVSDYGASEDDEIFQAYSTYKDSRKKLKDIQKSRGYFKNDGKYQNNAARDQAKQAEKARSRCAACHRLGHWAGDAECPAATRSGPKKVFKGGKSKGSGKGRAGKAYMVGESPTFFILGDDLEEEEAYCDMVFDDGVATSMTCSRTLDSQRQTFGARPIRLVAPLSQALLAQLHG